MGTEVIDVADQVEPRATEAGTTEAKAEETSGIGSPISNDAYNVITALQAKLEGLEAYRKYAKDSDAPLWKELCQHEITAVGKLVDRLEKLVAEGRFRMQEPGETSHH